MPKAKKPLLFKDHRWDFSTIRRIEDAVEEIAIDELRLDIYPNQIEIITSDQMLDAYSSIGLPVMYKHWSFGKRRLRDEFLYRTGQQGLAYEIVVNTNPCISYLMEENTATMQTVVIAHAAMGHNHFFKNNQLFREWTDAEGIIDYLVFARKYISNCEEEYGFQAVEELLDSCHALMDSGVDRYRRPGKLSKVKEEIRQEERRREVQRAANDLWRTLPNSGKPKATDPKAEKPFPTEPQENILYFLEKNSPVLKEWQREIVRIVRKISQYFYPQKQTRVMNEGCACFVHYYIMNRLWETGQITEGAMLEFLASHTSITGQPGFDSQRYNGINPYWLGFKMFMDMKRICQEPTKEDALWFPNMVGKDWVENFKFAVAEFRDESFIRQYLSPSVIKDGKLFLVEDDNDEPELLVSRIHDNRGYKKIRRGLARQQSLAHREPDLQIVDANIKGNRHLQIRHNVYDGVRLTEHASEVIEHLQKLWGYPVEIEINDVGSALNQLVD